MNPLHLITLKILNKKKKRTIITIFSIAIATFLMIGVSTVFSSYRENDIKQYIASYGNYHVAIRRRTYADMELLRYNTDIQDLQSFVLWNEQVDLNDENSVYVIGTEYDVLEKISLKEGTLPTSEKEVLVSPNFFRANHYDIKLGDTFTVQDDNFKIVGIYEENYYVNFLPYSDGEILLTTFKNPMPEMETSFLVTFKEIKGALQKYEKIGLILGETPKYGPDGARFESVTPNYGLLSKYGETTNKSSENLKIGVILILVTIIGIISSFVIYNSFAVSVLERKRQYGIMRSIGATKGQIFGSVFFEALVVGILGITLGILFLLTFGNLVIFGINTLQKHILVIPYTLELYPPYYYIALFGILLVMLISVYFPAKRSSEITPLEAIRSNKDIKVTKRTQKSGKWLGKIFGIEAMIAQKNRKRNQKRYRTSTVALVISVMLLLLGSIFFDALEQQYQSAQSDYQVSPYLSLSLTTQREEDLNQIYSELKKMDGTQSVFQFSNFVTAIYGELFGNFTKEFKERYPDRIKANEKTPVFLIIAGKETYEELKQRYHLKNGQILFLNSFLDSDGKEISMFELEDSFDYTFCRSEEESCTFEIKNIKVINEKLKYVNSGPSLTFVIPRELQKEFRPYNDSFPLKTEPYQRYYIETKNYMNFNENVENILLKYDVKDFSIQNDQKDMEETRIQMVMYQYSAYGIATLFFLIALMSVSTSIVASMEGRRKEYAILRSIGMTEKQFGKMIFFESFLFAMKAFFYSFFFSHLLLYVTNWWMKQMQPGVDNPLQVSYPWVSFFISIVFVFLIILMIMFVALKTMKKDNLIDIIKEDSY